MINAIASQKAIFHPAYVANSNNVIPCCVTSFSTSKLSNPYDRLDTKSLNKN